MSNRIGLLLPAVALLAAAMRASDFPGPQGKLIEGRFPEPPPEQWDVFVSFCEKDRSFWERIEVHLEPMRQRGVKIYSYDLIEPGDKIRKEVRSALLTAVVAILLISADYLASDLMRQEFPDLLDQAERNGRRILWLQVGICDLSEMEKLTDYKEIGTGKPPLCKLKQPKQDEIYVEMLGVIRKTLIGWHRYPKDT
jgi:hypothetical protein